MKLRDLMAHAGRKGGGAAQNHGWMLRNRLRRHLRSDRKAELYLLGIEMVHEYLWEKDQTVVNLVDRMTGELVFSFTDVENPDQFKAAVFALQLRAGDSQ